MAKIKLRRDTYQNWYDANPVLASGEPAYDTTNNKIKVGDGTTAWRSLSYLTDETGGGGADLGSFTIESNVLSVDSGTDIYVETFETGGPGESRLVLKPQDDGVENPTRLEGSYGVGIWSNITSGDSIKKWQFGTDGKLTLPAGGDIVDSNGSSVLGGSTGQINFDGTDIYGPSNEVVSMYAQDGNDNIRASLRLDPGEGYPIATLQTAYTNDSTFYDDAWTGTAQWISNGGGGRVDFTSETLKNFLQNTLIYCDRITIEVNGQNAGQYFGANTGPDYVQFNVENPPVESPDTVVSIKFIYDEIGKVVLDHNDNSLEIDGGTGLEVRLKTRQSINLRANGKDWTFDSAGNLNLPNGGAISTNYGYIDQDSGFDNNTLRVSGGNGVSIYTDEDGKRWMFDSSGDLTLPEGGDILDSNGDSVLGAAALTDDKEVKVTVGNTEYWAIINRANNNDGGVQATAVAYDSNDNMITLHVSDGSGDVVADRLVISKFDSSANLLWQKQIENDLDGNLSHDVVIDSNNNIIVAASMDNSYPVDSIVVMKFTSGGSIVWQQDYQSSVVTENIESVSINTTVGGGTYLGNPVQVVFVYGQVSLLAAGWTFQSSPDNSNWTTLGTVLGSTYDSGSGETTVFFADATFGGNLDGNLNYRLVGDGVNTWQEVGGMVLQGNNIFIGAQYENNNSGSGYNGLLMKISATDGTLAWSKTFNYGTNTRVWGIDVGADGNIVVVGQADGVPVTGAFAAKFSGSGGNHIWTKVLFDPEANKEYMGADLVIDSANNIFVTVNSRDRIVHEDGNNTQVTVSNLLKLNSSGTVQWMRRGGPGPCATVGTGIDCDNSGNIYLSALTVAQKNPTRDFNDFANDTTRNVLAIVKYNNSGTVLWQRYLEADGYEFAASASEGTGWGQFDADGINRGRLLSLNNSGKLAVQVTVKHRDLDDYTVDTNYYESITFQIDQDGREMTIGSGQEKFTVKESRIPGKFVTAPVWEPMGPVEPFEVNDLMADMVVTDPAYDITEGILAQHIFKSAPYEYVFGNDGTLTIPNDGDIRLVQTQIGWFSIFGPAWNDSNDVDIRCNVVDPNTGDVYVAGQTDQYNAGFVARYNSQGQIQWSIRLYDNDNEYSNRCNAIKLNPVTGNVVVLCEYYDASYDRILLVEIDPDTAKVVNTAGLLDNNNNNNVTAYDFDFFSNGDTAVVGRKYDEFNSISVVPQEGSEYGVLIMLNSATASNAVHPVTNSWYISGTSINGRAAITSVNSYGINGGAYTLRLGSGATFNVVANDGDPGVYTVTLNAAGTNYRQGRQIIIPGTSLGGTTPANDLTITVASVVDNVDGAIATITYTGTADGGALTNYNAVSGNNYSGGIGGLDITFDYDTGYATGNYNIVSGGTGFVSDDVITVLGEYLGGTTPANNLTINVTSVSVSGAVTNVTFSGTAQTTKRKLTIDTNVNEVYFNDEGSWSVVHEVGGEAFVIRVAQSDGEVDWSLVLSAGGQYDTERYLSVAVDSSDNVYAAGEMVARNNAAGSDLNSYWCAVVSKLNSSGVHQWTKALNTSLDDSYAKCVAVRGSTLAVSHNNNGNQAIVTKLDTSGNIKWQRTTYTAGGDSSVAIDANGDIYAVIESNVESAYEDVIKVIRFAANGEVIYHKFVGTLVQQGDNSDERFKNGRNLTLDADYMYISGYTSAFASNQNNGFLVKLPKAGDCDGSYGVWSVQTDAYDVDLVESTEAAAFTPILNEGNWMTWSPDFTPQWYDPSDNSYYHTFQEIRDRDGGAIEFADGTRQTSSAQQISQIKVTNGADYRLTLEDMGKHIYVTASDTNINIPYNSGNPLPIGFTVVIVNNSGGIVNIDADGGGISVLQPGNGNYQYWDLANPGMATLLKVDTDTWFITGNVTVD